jgi:hypothetical protein
MKTLIEMAREAEFNHPRLEEDTDYYKLERFAAIVAENARKSMMQLLTDPENQPTQYGTVTVEYMQNKIANKRNACTNAGFVAACSDCDERVFSAIRATGETK